MLYKKYMKRILDMLCCITLVPPAAFIVIFCAAIIKAEDGGPVFYLSKRLGMAGREFTMLKLRTMRVDAPDLRNSDGSTFNAEHDARVTRIGKFLRQSSLDELPQILNVLKGDMSLIGPRPDLPDHLLQYQSHHRKKLDVRPGLSGYSQAFFRNTIDWNQRLENDIHYVENMSFRLDLLIFLKTIHTVVARKGVFRGE